MLKPVVLLALVLSMAPSFAKAACPVINGKYEMRVQEGDKLIAYPFHLYTRVERGVVSYTIDVAGNFQVADGVARPHRMGDRLGKIKVSCEENSMIYDSWEDGSEDIFHFKVTPLSKTSLKIESTNKNRTGTYLKI